MADLLDGARRLTHPLRNAARRARRSPDYVVLTLDGRYPELPPPSGSFWERLVTPRELSLRELAQRLAMIAEDPSVSGVVLRLRSLEMPLARLQTLRSQLMQLREEADKHVVTWATSYDRAGFYLATAADEILLQPGGAIGPLGLSTRVVFLKDALEQLGIRADFLKVAPHKTAADPLQRAEMSPEMREMMDWLLDDLAQEQLAAITAGRGVGREQAQRWLDGAPFTDQQARQNGLVDAICNEEDVPEQLGPSGDPAQLHSWAGARRRLPLTAPTRPGRHVALLRVEGDIVDGPSRRPPRRSPVPIPMVTHARAGDATIVEQIRRLERNRRVGAVVVWVDSGGGSATASEAIASALERLETHKPVVAALGASAASGGYYVATPARWIVARPGTLTGSIGVLYGKLVLDRMLAKLRIHHETLRRGEQADVFDPTRGFREAERERVRELIERIYGRFLDRVARSRTMSRGDVEAIAGGRVWTGRQAHQRGLVDELGGLDAAIREARKRGGLSANCAVREVPMPTGARLSAPAASPSTALLDYVLQHADELTTPQAYCLSLVYPEFGHD